jgi:hypothetical protein
VLCVSLLQATDVPGCSATLPSPTPSTMGVMTSSVAMSSSTVVGVSTAMGVTSGVSTATGVTSVASRTTAASAANVKNATPGQSQTRVLMMCVIGVL